MVDDFIDGHVSRISPEAPVPVLNAASSHQTLGGAGNVIRNLSSLGVQTYCLAALDTGKSGAIARTLIEQLPHTTAHFIIPAIWSTPLKTRFCAQGQHILRVDEEDACTLSPDDERILMSHAHTLIPQMDCVILSDYAKGLLTPNLCQSIIHCARQHGVRVIVDPKGQNYTKYTGAYIVTPNSHEVQGNLSPTSSNIFDYATAAGAMMRDLNTDHILVTLGARGMVCVSQNEDDFFHTPSRAHDVFDVSGAGDTVVATLSLALALHYDIKRAVSLANTAAGIVVGRKGTATITYDDVWGVDNGPGAAAHPEPHAHVLDIETAMARVTAWKNTGATVGFTNGCFDLLHPGHLSLLSQARAQCDYLIVGLNGDDSIKRLKGSDRPIQNERHRAQVLSALSYVSGVVIFHEDTPLNLIQKLRPDVLIKGADYTVDQVVGADDVIRGGGRVVLADLKIGHSTTKTVQILQKTA